MASKNDVGYKFKGNGLTTKEKRWGASQFKKYRENYPHLHKFSDLSMLEELIFQEALHERIKDQISQITNLKDKENKKNESADSVDSLIPAPLRDALKESTEVQFKMKEKLGLFEDKTKLDAFRDFEILREDFKLYRQMHPNSFKCTCPSCSFIFFLKRRTDSYEEIDSPWFKDKVLCNPPLWDAYKCKEISKKRIAAILGTSEDNIDWLAEKIFATKKNDETLSLPVDDSSKK